MNDSPPTVAEITGLERLAAAAAEQLWREIEADADRRDREAADFQRQRLIAQGRIKPAHSASRAEMIATGRIKPADPAEIEQACRPKLAYATFAPTGDPAKDEPWFGKATFK